MASGSLRILRRLRLLRRGVALALAFASLGAGTALQAQETRPPLADTATWLHNIYAGHAQFQLNNGVSRTVSVTFNGCSVRIYTETDNGGTGPVAAGTEVTDLELGRLDPSNPSPHTNYERTFASMVVRTYDGAPSMKTTVTSSRAAPHVEMRSEYTLLLPLGEYTSRTAKAWVHAIQLCGGRASAF